MTQKKMKNLTIRIGKKWRDIYVSVVCVFSCIYDSALYHIIVLVLRVLVAGQCGQTFVIQTSSVTVIVFAVYQTSWDFLRKINLYPLILHQHGWGDIVQLLKNTSHNQLAQFSWAIVVHNLALLTMAQRGILYKIHKYIEFIIYTYISRKRPDRKRTWRARVTMISRKRSVWAVAMCLNELINRSRPALDHLSSFLKRFVLSICGSFYFFSGESVTDDY